MSGDTTTIAYGTVELSNRRIRKEATLSKVVNFIKR